MWIKYSGLLSNCACSFSLSKETATFCDGDHIADRRDPLGGLASLRSKTRIPMAQLDEIILHLQTHWMSLRVGMMMVGRGTGPRSSSAGLFPGQIPYGPYASPEALGYEPMTLSQASFAREAFELWDDLIAINLIETTDWGNVDISMAYSDYTAGGDNYANVDDGEIGSAEIWLNTSKPSLQDGTLNYGTGFQTYLHEVGHLLGLSHPGSYNQEADYGLDAEYAEDTNQYTLMSYFAAGLDGSGADRGSDPTNDNLPYSASTPLLHDIAAIQAMYGAALTTRTGDTTYGFNSNAGRGASDFTKNNHPIIAIWDAGGIDTLDTSGFSNTQTIDLTVNLETGDAADDHFSSIGGLQRTLPLPTTS